MRDEEFQPVNCLYRDHRTPLGSPCAECPLMNIEQMRVAKENVTVLGVLCDHSADLMVNQVTGEECGRTADALAFARGLVLSAVADTIGRALYGCHMLKRSDELPPRIKRGEA